MNAVKVSIQDTTVGGSSCWNGATFTAACPNYVAATGTTAWSYALAAGALTNAHNYTATVETIDNVTNTNTAATTASWTYDTSPPVYASSATDRPGTHIDLTFTEATSGLNTGITPAASAFTVVVGGSGDTVTGVTMTDATHIRLTLTTRAYGNQVVTVAYTQPGSNQVRDNAGNLLATFGAQTVTNTAPAALVQSTLAAAPTSITANGATTSTITVQLKNSAGTNLTLSGGVVTLSTTDGTFPGACTSNCATTDNGDGTYTATLTSSTTAHNVTVSAKLDGSSLTNTQTVTFAPGVATKLVVTGSGSQTAGVAQSLTITAFDAFGNIATGYTGAKNLTFSGANSSTNPATPPTVTNNLAAAIGFGSTTAVTFTNGVSTTGGSMKLYKVEAAVVAVTDGTISAAGADRLSVTVNPAAATRLVVTGSATQTAGAAQTVTVTATDPYGNTDTGYTGAKNLTYSGANSSTNPVTSPTVTNSTPTATNFGSATTNTFTSGVSTITGGVGSMKLYKVETAASPSPTARSQPPPAPTASPSPSTRPPQPASSSPAARRRPQGRRSR